MKFLKQLLVPNRFDGTLLALLVVGACGLIFWFLDGWDVSVRTSHVFLFPLGWIGRDEFLAIVLSPVLLVTMACGVCLGWWKFGLRRWLLLTLGCLLCFYLPLAFGYLSGLSDSQATSQSSFVSTLYSYQANIQPKFTVLNTSLWIVGSILASLLISSGLILLCRLIPLGLKRVVWFILGKGNRNFEVSRSKILIWIAGCMFVLAVINNALVANGYNIYRDGAFQNSGFWELVISIGFGIVAFFLLVFWPSWSLLRSEKPWIAAAGVATLAVPAIAFAIINETRNSSNMPFWLALGLLVTGSLFFAATVSSLKHTEARVRPSVWSGFILIMAGFIVLSPKFFDYTIFFQGTYSARSMPFQDRFSIACESGKLLWKSGGQVRGFGGNYFAICPEDAENDDLFVALNSLDDLANLTLQNLHPAVNTNAFINKNLSTVTIVEGELTASQLADLAASTQNHLYIGNLKISNPDDRVVVKTNAQLTCFADAEGSSISQLLASIEKFQSSQPINIYSMITEETWLEIVRISHDSNVVLHHLPDQLPPVSDPQLSFKNIIYHLAANVELTKSQVEFLFDSEAHVDIQFVHDNHQLFFDLAFAIANEISIQSNLLVWPTSEQLGRSCSRWMIAIWSLVKIKMVTDRAFFTVRRVLYALWGTWST